MYANIEGQQLAATMSEAEKQVVSFACQRCLQPIVLDEQLEKISVHAMAELSCG